MGGSSGQGSTEGRQKFNLVISLKSVMLTYNCYYCGVRICIGLGGRNAMSVLFLGSVLNSNCLERDITNASSRCGARFQIDGILTFLSLGLRPIKQNKQDSLFVELSV